MKYKMNMKSKWHIMILLLALIQITLLLQGCGTAKEAPTQTLTISAAKSLSECLPEVINAYKESNPNVTIDINFGSSGAMRQQIEQGAEVDLYMPAGIKDMNLLEEGDMVASEEVVPLLTNQMALIVPAGSESEITSFESLKTMTDFKFAVGEPESVPAGKYGVEVLNSLSIFDQISSHILYAKDVREVLTWVETGNADGGIVYLTEALLTDKVDVVEIADPETHTPILYPAAVLKESKNQDLAHDFITFLQTEEASAIFDSYGYLASNTEE